MPRLLIVNDNTVETKVYDDSEVVEIAKADLDLGIYSNYVGVKQTRLEEYVEGNKDALKEVVLKSYQDATDKLTRVFVGLVPVEAGFKLNVISIGKTTTVVPLPPVPKNNEASVNLAKQLIDAVSNIGDRAEYLEVTLEKGTFYTGPFVKALGDKYKGTANLAIFTAEVGTIASAITRGVTKDFKYLTPHTLNDRERVFATNQTQYDKFISEVNRDLKNGILEPYKEMLKTSDTVVEPVEPEVDIQVLSDQRDESEKQETPLSSPGITALENRLLELKGIDIEYKKLKEDYNAVVLEKESIEDSYTQLNQKHMLVTNELSQKELDLLEATEKVKELTNVIKYDTMLTQVFDSLKVIEHTVNTIESVIVSDEMVMPEYRIETFKPYDTDDFSLQDVADIDEELEELQVMHNKINVEIEELEEGEDEELSLDELPSLDELDFSMLDDFLENDDYAMEKLSE